MRRPPRRPFAPGRCAFSREDCMDPWLQQLTAWLPSGGPYYVLVGLISFFESLAVAGIFVPGSVLVVFAGFLAAHGKGAYAPLVAVAAFGAIIGDLLSYWLGARFGGVLRNWPVIQKRQETLHKAEVFFLEHGGKSVFLGRFVGFLRPFIPFVAGGAQMRPPVFALFALISGILWGLAYPGLGYFFGTSWDLVKLWTGRFGLFVAVLTLLLVIDIWFWKSAVPRLYRLWTRSRRRAGLRWARLQRRRPLATLRDDYPAIYAFLADRFTLRSGSGLYLTVGFGFSTLFAILFFWLVGAINLQRTLAAFDLPIYRMMLDLHHPATDRLITAVTCLGDWPVLLMTTVLLVVWLVLFNRDFSAVIVAVGMSGGYLLVVLLKRLFDRPRPTPFFEAIDPLSASFPSAHAFLVLILYGLLVYFLLDATREGQSRFHLVLGATFVVLLVGFSRLYLGIHWFSDVLGGFALAALWLTFLVTAAEMRRRYGGEFPWRPGVQLLHLRRPWRTLVLGMATLATLGGTAAYILFRLAGL